MDNIRETILDMGRHSLVLRNYLNHGTHAWAPPLAFLEKEDIEILIKALTKHNDEFREKIKKLKEQSDGLDFTGTTLVICLNCSGATRVSNEEVPRFNKPYSSTKPETTYCKNCRTYSEHWVSGNNE